MPLIFASSVEEVAQQIHEHNHGDQIYLHVLPEIEDVVVEEEGEEEEAEVEGEIDYEEGEFPFVDEEVEDHIQGYFIISHASMRHGSLHTLKALLIYLRFDGMCVYTDIHDNISQGIKQLLASQQIQVIS